MNVERVIRAVTRMLPIAALGVATASAQVPFVTLNPDPTAANRAFPLQNPSGPSGKDYQVNYPYPGQCLADLANAAMFPALAGTSCSARGAATSFACTTLGSSQRTAGGWATCGTPSAFAVLQPILADATTPKFQWEVLNPPDYTPDKTTFPNADYYEIGLHEAWGFQAIASAGLFPNPPAGGPRVPNGMQWTGLVCNVLGGCACPADLATGTFRSAYCSAGGKIPQGSPLFTPIWGVGQINVSGGPVTSLLTTLGLFAPGTPTEWSANSYVATWPSISIRGEKGRPVVVKWTNEFPNTHVLCPYPDAADWPCSIDRTFMGVKAKIDPATALDMQVPADAVNQYGSPQQPDNSWVTHLHGGEIPPGTDGFAEKWFGNAVTGPLYTPTGGKLVNPPFENPSGIHLKRPAGNFDTYTYPMVQEEALIWFHDHTLGKTHHNVIAGPAGFFPVKEPLKHGAVLNGACQAANCDYTWLDPVTVPTAAVTNIPLYDLFFAIQDRAFNEDGSLNFSNGLGQPLPPPIGSAECAALLAVNPAAICSAPGTTSLTPGVNPLVHPTWLPEYFGDHVLVNGVLWPRKATAPGWYRIRMVDGSDSRCWTIGFSTTLPAPNTKPVNNVSFWVLANDQGYLKNPVLAPGRQFTMCPGERYELLVNFGALPAGATTAYMTNSAAAPFPAGITPFAAGSPYAEMNVVMRFDVSPLNGAGIKSCGTAGAPASLTWDPAQPIATNLATACMPANPALKTDPSFVDLRQNLPATTVTRQVYLNERLDGVTLAPMGMQLNGVPFEYKVTETPKAGAKEVWQFINLTVDAHPMHPHLVKHQVVKRQRFNVGAYKTLLCGSPTCQPGPAPGGEMQVVPDVTPVLLTGMTLVTPASVDGGFKDATQVPPGMVTTIVAEWVARWDASGAPGYPVAGTPNAPGTAGCPNGTLVCPAPWTYETVASGPYVWHCHINSHEDSEMMRTSLVVLP
jgi:FtsP/CotA-like multicopper oxidase with cupredoxin domain